MKIIAILGLGKTGQSLAKHFSQQGNEVWGIDDRQDAPSIREAQPRIFEKLFLGGDLPNLSKVSRFFISPGVDPTHLAAQNAQKAGLAIEGELDLAFSLSKGSILAITGTNGKSTTTALLGEILKAEGLQVGVGGNLGTPYLDLVLDDQDYSHYVLEVSSFQLESTRTFRPHVAALLNLSDDHLDRHSTLEGYLQAKRKIFAFQEAQDYAVYNDDDLRVLEAMEAIPSQKVPFSNAKKVQGAYGNESELFWAPKGEIQSRFSLATCQLRGLHNLENMSAAIACAKVVGISDEAIQKTLNTFKGLPHRIQLVAEQEGIQYFDDSKATNVGAVVMSLASFDQDVILILGGVDKGGDYAPLKPLLRAKTKSILILGEAQQKILKSLEGLTNLIPVQDMEKAVQKAHELATPGCTVLLSPACSSFDMYPNYKERGQDFQNKVLNLIKMKQDGTATH